MRIILLIAISLFVGFGLASTAKKKDDHPSRCKRQVEELAIPFIILGHVLEVLTPISNQHPYPHWTEAPAEAATTSSPSPSRTTPATSTTPSPSRTPPPPTPSLSERCPNCEPSSEPRILLNYELEAFRHIPRTLFTFQVEALPAMRNSPHYDAEYMLINPQYIAGTSPDRFRHIPEIQHHRPWQPARPVLSTHITEENFWSLTDRIQCAIGNIRRNTRRINEEVDAANERLRELQRSRFIERQEYLETQFRRQRVQRYRYLQIPEPATYSNDMVLSGAFFNEVRQLAMLMDERSYESLHLLRLVRMRDCVLYGQAIKSHAKKTGVVGLPQFSMTVLADDVQTYPVLNQEEIEWLSNPTTEWFPRQSPITTNFQTNANVNDAPAGQTNQQFVDTRGPEDGRPFSLPVYYSYLGVWPGYERRRLTNTEVHIHTSLYPPASSSSSRHSSDIHLDSDSENGSGDGNSSNEDNDYDWAANIDWDAVPTVSPSESDDSNHGSSNSNSGGSIQGGSSNGDNGGSNQDSSNHGDNNSIHGNNDNEFDDMPPLEDASNDGSMDGHNLTVELTQNVSSHDDDDNDDCNDVYVVTIKRARYQKRHVVGKVTTAYCKFSGGKGFSDFMKLWDQRSTRQILHM